MFRAIGWLMLFSAVYAAVLLLSFREHEIAVIPSQYNGVVRVSENWRGVRFMRFSDDDAVQSAVLMDDPSKIVTPYVRICLAAFSFAPAKPLRVLVVGTGAGSMPFFARRFLTGAVVDTVDIDSGVLLAARSYFGFQEDAFLHAHLADGRSFVENVTLPYDVIILDAFNGADVPQHLVTYEFFHAVLRALAPDGVVASNVVFRDKSPHYDSIIRTLDAVFGRGVVAAVPGGSHQRIVFHFQSGKPPAGSLRDIAQRFADSHGYPDGVGVLSAVAPTQVSSGPVLFDLSRFASKN